MRPPVYIAVHVPQFPAQAMLRLRPHLLRQPIAVMKGIPPAQQVCSMNAPAKSIGVQIGMTRAQLEPFAGLHILSASPAEEESAQQALLQAAATFTPRVEPQPAREASFRMVLDMSGTSLIWGDVSTSIRRIAQAVRKLRVIAHFAASSNVQASLCLATLPRREPLVVEPGSEGRALATLPLHVLPLTPEQFDTLSMWGLRTLGELAALPVDAVIARLGQQGKRLHAMASGTQPHLLVPDEPPFLLNETMQFDHPVEMLDSLLFVIGPMLDQLIRRAANRSYALASITTHLALEGGGEHLRTVRPALPSSDRGPLLKLLQLDLQAHPPSAGITAIHLHAEVGQSSKVQMGLFAPQLPESMQLDVTLARIAAMVGQEYVGRARLLDTHSSAAFAMEPFTLTGPSSPAQQKQQTANTAVPPAIRRCRPPVDLRVYTQQRRHTAKPVSFYLRGKFYTVAEAYGPWRQSGDWWSTEIWSREEWDVVAKHEDRETLLALLKHDLLRRTWTLEALYD